jgi:hypothetical protein
MNLRKLASVQETSLDIVWIREGVVCLGNRPADRCYRAVLAVEGPSEAFADEVERVQPLLDGFARFLNALGQPGVLPPAVVQALVLAEPTDMSGYASRLEERASALPPHLAREALADAAWARRNGPGLGLLDRHAYVVVPAESVPDARLLGRFDSVRPRLAHWFRANPALDEAGAREALDVRCVELTESLTRAGVWAHRLDDPDLVRLFHACWSRRRDSRFERDVQSSTARLAVGRR